MASQPPHEVLVAIEAALARFKEARSTYPVPEPDLIQEVCASTGAGAQSVKRSVIAHPALLRKKVAGQGPFLVMFASDEPRMHQVPRDRLASVLADLGSSASPTAVAKALGIPVRGAAFAALKEQLSELSLARTKKQDGQVRSDLPRKGKTAKLKDPAQEDPAALTVRITEAVGRLKQARKYPCSAAQVQAEAAPLRSSATALRRHLAVMCKQGSLRSVVKSGKSVYLLAGEDPRYTQRLSDKLRLDLLAEIHDLRTTIAALEARLTPEPAAEEDPLDRHERVRTVLEAVKSLSERMNKRAVDLWAVRKALGTWPDHELDALLEQLGREWQLELNPVQDASRLSDKQKKSLLQLSDGLLIVSVAIPD